MKEKLVKKYPNEPNMVLQEFEKGIEQKLGI
jgi:hypothetical protein